MKKLQVAAIIPARYQSTRFEGKPLALIKGKPMIQRVYEQVKKCTLLDSVIIATDDERIQDVCNSFNAQVVMTSSEHSSGTDRIAEVALGITSDIVINIQGDEPLIAPSTIEGVIKPFFKKENIAMTTSSTLLTDSEEIENSNCVKVVTDKKGFALYFSRSAIPFDREGNSQDKNCYLHLGIYGYTKEILMKLSKMKPTPLENLEKLEQLRALENGIKIYVAKTPYRSIGVDVPEDITKVEKLL
ncbi:MAG: 3-deoxy-manno-octulosonate cytidylyltransferase [Nitrospinae bacterium]|nr:3-deoxy-manno-octulosonate cytidylyltransferase [Nitrospinota bacterium]